MCPRICAASVRVVNMASVGLERLPDDKKDDDDHLPDLAQTLAWEDYALFVLFIFFTLDACAHICQRKAHFQHRAPCPRVDPGAALPPQHHPPTRRAATPHTCATAGPASRSSPSGHGRPSRLPPWASSAAPTISVSSAPSPPSAPPASSPSPPARLTAILHSLKTVRPLLASVAYSVLFAMVLFSTVGVQAFKGSLRRVARHRGRLRRRDPPVASLTDWRSFLGLGERAGGGAERSVGVRGPGQNWLDLGLAMGTSVMQIPAIQRSAVYLWFTILLLPRHPRRPADEAAACAINCATSGSRCSATFPARGSRGGPDDELWDAVQRVPAMYQVFSSENWTDMLYSTAGAETAFGQSALTVLFVAGWMLFANYVFIAVINENFDVAEETKKGKQTSSYWDEHRPQKGHVTWLRQLNPYRWIRARPVEVKVEALPANLVLPIQKSLVQDCTVPRADGLVGPGADSEGSRKGKGTGWHYSSKSPTALQKLFAEETKNDIPLTTLKHGRNETLGEGDPHDEETSGICEELLAAVRNEAMVTNEELSDAAYERCAQKANFIRDHPSYDKMFWIFSQKNVTLLLIVIGGIVVEAIANPVYRRSYFRVRGAWFDIAESAFGLVVFVEFLIKIIADGFLFTPNAYVRSIWNLLDLVIMGGLLVNVTTGLIFIALWLIALIDRMRTTFESLIISGALRIIDAGILAILYMIPYAVWRLNIFNGKMTECNDKSVAGAETNEFTNTACGDAFGFVAPRVGDNPAPSTVFSFDSFRSSLLILFEIVSLEGWIDVMGVATSITGQNSQLETNTSQINAIFLIYNLLGAVVILTLFVSIIIIGNFSSKTGSAFLTAPQREWIDLQTMDG
ncbi:Ion transport protein-domain-containing protein [Mycena latifolia]|nr:Ion transport protein-domain-containing protein [Mycena latifolia]